MGRWIRESEITKCNGVCIMVVFRVDANSMIGKGHLMRCISIATSIKMMGGKILFVTRDDSDTEILDSKFMDYKTITSAKLCSEESTKELTAILKEVKADVCVVDSYDVSNEFFKAVKEVAKVVLIEDIFYDVYDVDALVNYNIYTSKMNYEEKYSSNTKLILGMDYAPVRPEIAGVSKKKDKEINTIFVSTGESDLYEIAPGIVDSLLDIVDDNVRLRVLTSKNSPTRDILYKMSNSSSQIIIEQDLMNMPKLLNATDIAVTASGPICYDFLTMGIPTCAFLYDYNQKMLLDTLVEKELVSYGGDYIKNKNKFYGDLVAGVEKLFDSETRMKYIANSEKFNLGKSNDNLAKEIIKFEK